MDSLSQDMLSLLYFGPQDLDVVWTADWKKYVKIEISAKKKSVIQVEVIRRFDQLFN